jgi:tripartite-type tricarboxylate transporter receptor subunit TctC
MRSIQIRVAGRIVIGLFLAFTCLWLTNAAAADYPEKPIRLVVPYPPGGQTDITARIITSASSAYLSQPFAISNVGGAGGAIGTAEVARAKADGYTLIVGANATNTYIPLSGKVPYGRDSFIPIAQLSASPSILAVNAASPYKTLKDFIDKAKKEPNTLKYSTAGVYSAHHIPAVLFAKKADIKIKHIPYAGGGPSMTALLGNHVDLNVNYPATFSSSIQGGLIRPLAVSSGERLAKYPNVPTLKELGIDVEVDQWLAIMAPKGTPEPVIKTLREAFKKICADKIYISMLEKMGEEVKYMDGPEFDKFWTKSWKETQELFASGVMTAEKQ